MKKIDPSAESVFALSPARFHLFLTLFVEGDRPRRRRARRMPAL